MHNLVISDALQFIIDQFIDLYIWFINHCSVKVFTACSVSMIMCGILVLSVGILIVSNQDQAKIENKAFGIAISFECI